MVDIFKRDIWIANRCCQRKQRVALIVGWGIVLLTVFFSVLTDMPRLIADIIDGRAQWVDLLLYVPSTLFYLFVAWVVLWTGGRACCLRGTERDRRPKLGIKSDKDVR